MYSNVDALPLGKLLQPKQEKGVSCQLPKLRKKIPKKKKK